MPGALAELPDWDEGTAAVLCTVDAAGAPHAIPVSTALRAGPRAIVLGLGARRASLAFVRERPAAALSMMAADTAFTAYGAARVVAEDVAGVVALRLQVETIADHRQPTFVVDGPVAWRWTDADAAARDTAVRDALRALC
jgi:pyridoxamine 5'-phosphate oxidase-like protein